MLRLTAAADRCCICYGFHEIFTCCQRSPWELFMDGHKTDLLITFGKNEEWNCMDKLIKSSLIEIPQQFEDTDY